uniref:Cytochrome P450 2W1 n=1 Tax=Crocodylus porosus TaxID=8502 RepID=A0A7M4FIZ3_CROPO
MASLTSLLSEPTLIGLLCALFLLFILYVSMGPKKSTLNFPPGPSPLPIIGNLHLLDIRRQDLSLMKIAEKYGPVFTVHFGLQKAVVLTGYEVVKEALLNTADVFADRPAIPIFYHIQNGNGVFFSSGELWKTTRRFTMATMRDLGMGKKLIEGRILEELHFLIEMIKSFNKEALYTLEVRVNSRDETLVMYHLATHIDSFSIVTLGFYYIISTSNFCFNLFQLFNFYPFLGFLFKPHKMILRKVEEVCVVLRKYIKTSRKDVDENNLRSYIDALLFKQQEKNKSNSLFHDANVLASTLDLVMAGTETTSTTLQWAILLMMKYPEIQGKVYAEIDRVLEPGCLPTFEARKNMPFTNAVIHEVQRFVTLLPHVPRCTSVNTNFKGYFIPKGTTVIPLLTSVLLDKTQWETPYQFNPNHFLDADGKFVKKDAFLPFSTGRRNCIGESLAKMELFLFFTGLLQKFTFLPPAGVTESDLDTVAEAGFTMRPRPQSARAVQRQ